jgi:hypothetical protein
VRAPGNGLDGSLVLAELEGRLVVELVPDHELVVVASGSQLVVFVIPLEAANFLLVASELAKPLRGLSHVTMVDGSIP